MQVKKWTDSVGRVLTWKESLIAACDYYGTFCGRYHSNEYWHELRRLAEAMDEDESRLAIERFEREADAEVAYARNYD